MLSKSEQETIIIFNNGDEQATIYTCSNPLFTKLNKLCKSNPDTYKIIKQDEYSKTYSFPKKLVSFRTPKPKRILTDEQREQLATRMKNARKKT